MDSKKIKELESIQGRVPQHKSYFESSTIDFFYTYAAWNNIPVVHTWNWAYWRKFNLF